MASRTPRKRRLRLGPQVSPALAPVAAPAATPAAALAVPPAVGPPVVPKAAPRAPLPRPGDARPKSSEVPGARLCNPPVVGVGIDLLSMINSGVASTAAFVGQEPWQPVPTANTTGAPGAGGASAAANAGVPEAPAKARQPAWQATSQSQQLSQVLKQGDWEQLPAAPNNPDAPTLSLPWSTSPLEMQPSFGKYEQKTLWKQSGEWNTNPLQPPFVLRDSNRIKSFVPKRFDAFVGSPSHVLTSAFVPAAARGQGSPNPSLGVHLPLVADSQEPSADLPLDATSSGTPTTAGAPPPTQGGFVAPPGLLAPSPSAPWSAQ